MKKIFFYQPPTESLRAYSNSEGKEQLWLPHGILCVAAMLNRSEWQIHLVDGRIDSNNGLDRISSEIGSSDVLACSVMTGNPIKWALKASSIAKERGATTLWGGPHVTIFPYQTLKHDLIDFIIPGACGEVVFAQWARSYDGGKRLIPFAGMGFKSYDGKPVVCSQNNKLISTPRDSLPSPCLDLIKDFSPYLMNDSAISSRTINHVTSLGCPYSCIFCAEPVLSNHTWNAWSAERAAKEVCRLIELSRATGLKLHDALFFVDQVRSRKFAREINSLNIKWAATIHPSTLITMSLEQLISFRQCGLSRLMVGLESGNQKVVDLINKKYDVACIPIIAEKLKQAGIIGMFTFLVGFPGVPKEEYPDTFNAAHLIYRIWDKHQIKIHFANPWPGTEFWSLASAFPGFSPPTTLEEWSNYDYYNVQMPFHDRRWEKDIESINKSYCPYFHA